MFPPQERSDFGGGGQEFAPPRLRRYSPLREEKQGRRGLRYSPLAGRETLRAGPSSSSP